jgi:hypothetical protein
VCTLCIFVLKGREQDLLFWHLHTPTPSPAKGVGGLSGTTFLINAVNRKFGEVFYFPPWDIAEAEFLDEIQTKLLRAVLGIRIRDPGLGAFLTPGSGIRDGRKSASGSGIRDEQPGSYFLELRNHFFCFFGVEILKFFDEDPGSGMETVRIRDGKKSDPG